MFGGGQINYSLFTHAHQWSQLTDVIIYITPYRIHLIHRWLSHRRQQCDCVDLQCIDEAVFCSRN